MSKSKYKKVSKRTGQFRSLLEKSVSKSLPKKRMKYESERINYTLPKRYIPDFVIECTNGRKIYLEVKGYLRYEDQVKMRAVKFTNPNLDIRFVFAKIGKIQGSKMTNIEWANKYNFPYCIGNPPKEWFK